MKVKKMTQSHSRVFTGKKSRGWVDIFKIFKDKSMTWLDRCPVLLVWELLEGVRSVPKSAALNFLTEL